MNKLIYAFDFDGTIVTNKFPEIGTPILNTIRLIYKVKSEGHYIVLNTMREGKELIEAVMFCNRLGIEFDAVNDNLSHMKEFYKNNPRKIFANYYIDDHNMFVDEVNTISDDTKDALDKADYYEHEYSAECDRAEKLEQALNKVCEFLSKEETCHKGTNQACKNQVVTLDECKKCWEDWCLDEA